jgi:hypothetical protein
LSVDRLAQITADCSVTRRPVPYRADTEEDIADMETDEAMTRRALELLGSKRNDAYEAALAALREDTQARWQDTLACDPDEIGEGEEPATADVEGLRRFLEGEVLPWFENRKKELANRPLIREQAFGEALDADKLERLGRGRRARDAATRRRPPPKLNPAGARGSFRGGIACGRARRGVSLASGSFFLVTGAGPSAMPRALHIRPY